eukprot:3026696-Pyramimonas_sp.AAC.1
MDTNTTPGGRWMGEGGTSHLEQMEAAVARAEEVLGKIDQLVDAPLLGMIANITNKEGKNKELHEALVQLHACAEAARWVVLLSRSLACVGKQGLNTMLQLAGHIKSLVKAGLHHQDASLIKYIGPSLTLLVRCVCLQCQRPRACPDCGPEPPEQSAEAAGVEQVPHPRDRKGSRGVSDAIGGRVLPADSGALQTALDRTRGHAPSPGHPKGGGPHSTLTFTVTRPIWIPDNGYQIMGTRPACDTQNLPPGIPENHCPW